MTRPVPVFLLILSAVLFFNSTAMAKDPAPDGRTYFVYVMGLDEDPYAIEPDCLTFNATQACTQDGAMCLDWERVEGGVQKKTESGFSLATEIENEGLVIAITGQGRVDSRGRKSSISAVGKASALDVQLNFSFSGRQTTRNRCRQMMEDF